MSQSCTETALHLVTRKNKSFLKTIVLSSNVPLFRKRKKVSSWNKKDCSFTCCWSSYLYFTTHFDQEPSSLFHPKLHMSQSPGWHPSQWSHNSSHITYDLVISEPSYMRMQNVNSLSYFCRSVSSTMSYTWQVLKKSFFKSTLPQ